MADDKAHQDQEIRNVLAAYIKAGVLEEVEIDGRTLLQVREGQIGHIEEKADNIQNYSLKFFRNTLEDIVQKKKREKRRERQDLPFPDQPADSVGNRNTKSFNTRIRGSLAERVDRIADQIGSTRQDLVEEIVRSALEQHEAGNPHAIDETRMFSVRLPKDLIERADTAAQSRGVTRTVWFGALLETIPEP